MIDIFIWSLITFLIIIAAFMKKQGAANILISIGAILFAVGLAYLRLNHLLG